MVDKKANVTSSTALISTISAKPKATEKGIIRKGQRKNLLIIIDNETYFVSIKALMDVLNGKREITAVYGY